MRDEDLERCPRCKEDMWKGQELCRNCQHEDELEEDLTVPPCELFECDVCGCVTDAPEGMHYCYEDNSDE